MAFALLSLSSLSFWISIDQWLLCCHRGAMIWCALAFALLSLWLSATLYFHSYWYLSAAIDHWHLKCCLRGAMTRRAMAFACRWIAFLPPDKPLWPQVTNHIQYHVHIYHKCTIPHAQNIFWVTSHTCEIGWMLRKFPCVNQVWWRPCAAKSGLIPTVTLQQTSLSISYRFLTGLSANLVHYVWLVQQKNTHLCVCEDICQPQE